MSRRLSTALILVLLILPLPARELLAGTFRAAPKRGVPDVYLVVLADRSPVASVAQDLARTHGGNVEEVWSDALRGFVIRMPEARARKLAEDPRVLSVEQDFAIEAAVAAPVGDCYSGTEFANTRPLPSANASPQVLTCSDPDPLRDTGSGQPLCVDNWGLDRIDQTGPLGATKSFAFVNNGSGVHVYVLDSGIRRSHDEFKDANGVSRVRPGVDARFNPVRADDGINTNDCYGHGTHVAGIIAGRTYGVAKNAFLYPIRIIGPDPNRKVGTTMCPLEDPSETTAAKAIRGLNWIAANAQRPAIVNWSGGNDYNTAASPTVGAAVQGILSAGIVLVQSAGNQTSNTNPMYATDACNVTMGGRYPDVIVAGGMDEYEGRWMRRDNDPDDARYFPGDVGSNIGACIDVWAPAAHVISAAYGRFDTGANNLACRLSGTSMAAPHVAGAAAVYLQSNPTATPAEVERALRSRGTWNRLQSAETNPNTIGRGSDNVIVFSDTRSPATDLPPVARFSVSCPGKQCVFDASASTDDGGITSYTWDFGAAGTATGVIVRRVLEGTTRVTLRVTDAGNRTDHAMSSAFPGTDPPPTASFTIGCSGRTCTTTATATDNGTVTYHWNWGDNTTSTGGPTNSHTYAAGGSYTVTLTVTDNVGQTAVATATATPVGQNPVPRVTFFCEGKACRFDGSTSTDADGTIVKYAFEYYQPDASGNWVKYGNTVEQTSPVHEFPLFPLERFQVRLSVQDHSGLWSVAPAVRYGVAKASTEVPLVFYATEPCSVGSSVITSDQTKLVQVEGAVVDGKQCVPSHADITAVAVVVRLTNVAAYPGYLRTGTDAATSILNLASGRNEHSNFVVLPTNANGQIDLTLRQFGAPSPTTATLTVDTVGYFRRANASPPTITSGGTVGPLWYKPLAPCVLFDTRTEAPGISSSVVRLFDLRNRCGVTGSDVAVALQAAVINPTTSGRAVAYASASSTPAGPASLDVTANRNVSTAAISKLSTGMLEVAATIGAADMTLATTGVFTKSAGQQYFVTPPCRLLDTRQNVNGKSRLAHNTPLAFQVRGQCGIPSHATSALLYVTVLQADGIGHVRLYATGGAASGYAAANFKASESIGSSAIVPLGATFGDVTALLMLAGTGADLVVDSYGYFSDRVNLARTATVTVSSTYDATRFPASSMIDGDRRALGWGSGTGGWSDGTRLEWPDHVGIQLPAVKEIEEIDIFTLPDDYASGTDPYEGLTFTEDGIQDFNVFYRDAVTNEWVPIAAIVGNDQVWRRIVLPQPIRTSQIWIAVNRSLTNYSRIVEVELWEAK